MTRVRIIKTPRSPYQMAAIDVPVIVGDVPGSISVCCAHETAVGALAQAAAMAAHVASDPTIAAIVPEGVESDIDAVSSIAAAARAGFPVLHAASMTMTKGQRKLAARLQSEAKTFGGPDDLEAHEVGAVGGFFDSITDLAKSAVNSVINAADPDHWPDWMKKLAKPVARATLDAAAVAVFGPAGPAAVETMINVVDKARQGDADAAKQIESIAKKALKGDKASKVLMSAVHAADGSTVTGSGSQLGDMYSDWQGQWGAAFEPGAFGDDDQGEQSYENGQRLLPPQTDPDGGFDDAYYERAPLEYGRPEPGQQGPDFGQTPDGQPWPVDANGQPWPEDEQGYPVDPAAPQVDPGDVRLHAAGQRTNRGAGARGGGVTVTRGKPGFAGARDNRSKGKGKPPAPPAWMSPQQKSMWLAAWQRQHGGR